MADTQRETESKFDVAPDFVLGELSDFADRDDTVESGLSQLVSTYYDTAGQRLLRSHLTLRRRTGTDDTGWHLKVPGDGFRTELRWPLAADGDPDELPAELQNLIGPFVGDEPVRASVTLRVERTRHRVRTPAGELRLEVADDEVRADPGADPVRTPRWREIEIELGPAGDRADLDRVAALLTGRAAAPSRSSSKLFRALHGQPVPAAAEAPGSAGAVLVEYLRTQCDAITAGHFAIAAKPFEVQASDEPHEAVHQTRVATRRLRAALRTFAPLFDADRAVALEDELQWFAAELGEVRDREVLRVRLAHAVAALPPDLLMGPVAARIDTVLLSELRTHAEALLATMRDERYRVLIADLADWRASPPWTPLAQRPAVDLRQYVAKAERTLARRMKRAGREGVADEVLHSARKAGKRARYAAEAGASALGRHGASLAKSASRLQTLLGEHQDSIVAAELLRRIAAEATAEGENAFSYGILVGEERQIAARTAREARRRS